MADLQVEDATVAKAQATFRTAANRLEPVARALQGLNAEVAGASPLIERFQEAHSVLAAELGIIGQALAELAKHASEAGTAFGHLDQALSQQVKGAR